MPDRLTATPLPESPTWTPPEPEELNRLLPHYRIECLLGQGGMGAVYKGWQPELDRPVAIKLLPVEASADAAFVATFKHEARTLAKLHHSRIITIHDLGQTSAGHLYFVMEYLDGSNLRTVLSEGGLSAEQALLLVEQICDALDAAHQQGIVHRDIKPENILLTRDGYVKLIDFGLASPVGTGDGGTIFGTPGYAAPEVHAGTADHRADLFALGVVLYEMLTGDMPATPYVAAARKAHTDPRIDHVLRRALQALPGNRFQHASELKAAVEHVRTTPLAPAHRPAPAKVTRPIPRAAPVPRPPVVTPMPRRTPLKTYFFIGLDAALIAFSAWWLWTRLHPQKTKVSSQGSLPTLKAAAVSPAPDLPKPPSLPANLTNEPLPGRWLWRGDLVVVFNADGSFARSDAASGQWTCEQATQAERVYRLIWKTGKEDLMTLKSGEFVLHGTRTGSGEELSAFRLANPNLPRPPAKIAREEGFIPILDSEDQQGWKESGSGEMWAVNGIFTMTTPNRGRGIYCYTARQFSDFVLRFDFAVDAWSANSGVYLRLPALSSETPPLAMETSYEVEIFGEETGGIPFAKPRPDLSPPLRLGEWNQCEITVVGQEYTVKLNGARMNDFTGSRATQGYIGFQNFPGPADVHFSNVRIKDLSPRP